jgi:hypothetical protein
MECNDRRMCCDGWLARRDAESPLMKGKIRAIRVTTNARTVEMLETSFATRSYNTNVCPYLHFALSAFEPRIFLIR